MKLMKGVVAFSLLATAILSVILVVDRDTVGPYLNMSGDEGERRSEDVSPIPNYKGAFISLGRGGQWRTAAGGPPQGFVEAAATQQKEAPPPPKKAQPKPPSPEPEANCSKEAIVYYADQAPFVFDPAKKGLLYGVKTHTKHTRVKDMPGYNACALVVYAILKKAGCKWAKLTASAKKVYDMAWEEGWRPSEVQKPGCLIAWNSIDEGWRPRIGRGKHKDPTKKKGVKFRHLGISTGSWMAIDNTSYFSRPSPGITFRPIRYEPALYLCPVEKPQPEKSVENDKK